MPTRLPVYRVATTGIQESQAHELAEALKIPAKGLRWLDGEASFVDRDKYLAVPSVRIEDPDIVARFTEATTNHYPEIPIAVTGIDYAALDRHVPFADDLALRSAAAALESAGLTPASARPMVGHTVFITVAIGADGAEQEQRRTLLDTHVSYRFVVDGYPLVGPGAQIQILVRRRRRGHPLDSRDANARARSIGGDHRRRRDSPPDLVLAGRRCCGRRPARLPGAEPAQRIERCRPTGGRATSSRGTRSPSCGW